MVEQKVKALIQSKGLLQKTVAEMAGYPERTFSRMLNGHTPIRDADVWKIAQALGLTPNELYGIADHAENGVKIQFAVDYDIKVLSQACP